MRLSLTTFLTLDAVMQAPGDPNEDPSGGFEHGGWLVPYADADMGQLMPEVFAEADAFQRGRRTYDIFDAHWPRVSDPDDPDASRLNGLHGSGALARTLMRHDLIDEYRLLTFPVMLGTGRRLFADGFAPPALRLVQSSTTSTGVTICVYETAGKSAHASFALDQ